MPNLSKAYLGAIPLFNQIETTTNYYDPNIWNRPSGWFSVPSIVGQQKFIGLHKVDGGNDGNHVTIRMSGDFCVEWGDGTSGTYIAGSLASKNLDYSSYSNVGENIFGYRQAIISAYPISGSNLNLLDLSVSHPDFDSYTSKQYNTKWLDVYLNGPLLSTGGLTIAQAGNSPRHRYIEQATIYNLGNSTSLANEFNGCANLKSVILGDTSKVTSALGMFSGCSELITAPTFQTSGITNITSMFHSCTSLKYLPIYNLSRVTNMISTFQGCTQLESVSGFSFGGIITNMFASCTNLSKVNCSFSGANLSASTYLPFSSNPNLTEFSSPDPIRLITLNVTNGKFSASGLNNLFQNLDTNRHFVASGTSGSSLVRASGVAGASPWTNNNSVFFRNISGGSPLNESTIYLIKSSSSSGITLTTGTTTNPAIVFDTPLTGAEMRINRIVRVTQNYGTSQPGYDPSIATGKFWTVVN